MKRIILYSAVFLLAVLTPSKTKADSFQFGFTGPGVSGTVSLTYGALTDATYPQAREVTGISGQFSDANLGILNATIFGLVPINHSTPEPTNLLAPNDFSRLPVAAGTGHGSLSYDNLLYPGGSPQSASDYPFHGGFLDIYGLLFNIGDGRVVNLWSNGVLPRTTVPDYGVAVATEATQLDYVGGGVAVTPEPSTVWLLGLGTLAVVFWRRSLPLQSETWLG